MDIDEQTQKTNFITALTQKPIWGIGFRPFFFLGSLYSVIIMGHWLMVLYGKVPATIKFDSITAHGHEMVFGFTVAIIAGFLLTASANWTGTKPTSGFPLMCMVAIWFLGRLAFLGQNYLPFALVAVVDIAFLPSLIVALGPRLINDRKLRNVSFLLWLSLLTIANILSYVGTTGKFSPRLGILFGVYVVMLLIIILGGRVIPFFTNNAVPGAQSIFMPRVGYATIAAFLFYAACDVLSAPSKIIAALALICAILNFIRWWGWKIWKTLHNPILTILFIAYLWLPIGFLLKTLSLTTNIFPHAAVIHLFTVGVIGTMIIAMISRVTLGHTGRKIQAPISMIIAYVMMNLAAVLRIVAYFAPAEHYKYYIMSSGILWMTCFLLFFIQHFKILTTPRPDGRPG